MPKSYFNGCFNNIIKPQFCFMTIEEVAQECVYHSIAKKWVASRQKLWYEFKDSLKTKDEIMDNVPVGINRDRWTSFVNYRYKEETQNMCKRNAENRKKQTVPHTGGSKPNSRRRAEMMAETERKPGRAQLYLATHTKKDGSYVNDEAKEICPSDAASRLVSPANARSSGASNPSDNH
ncbi:uncharacterized protein [Nicotiana tomentosiformis]|uniref:uncharacterized protein isoform X2 n=1 Tax=Nicotiana tomentosiformis TaxID=4098 RepID=UPI001447AF12|nr:uncharacterized protein LOC104114107 isoform X3 [Nicotiana tomentosiformis]